MNSDNNQPSTDIYEKIIASDSINNEDVNGQKKEDETSFAREVVEMIICFIVIVALFLLLQVFVAQHIEVNGRSMETTLNDKDHLILEKLSYRFNQPARFDIIVFRPFDTEEEKNTYFIKRVIGLPGETIQIEDGHIYVNGELLQEDYGNEAMKYAGIASDEIVLESDEYFLLGDNRNNSSDSRSSDIGPVSRDAIIGRAWARIWPLADMEILNH